MSEIVEVTILGRKFSLKSEGNAELIREIASFVNEKISDISKASPGLTDTNLAILASLNIAEDYFGALGKQRAVYTQIEKRCDDLLDYIDSKL